MQSCLKGLRLASVFRRHSTPWSVGPSVRPSVRPSHFTFLASLSFLALQLLPKCSADLKYGPCPSARDWVSRVTGLVKLRAVLGSGPEGVDDLCFHTYGGFSPSPPPSPPQSPASRPEFQSRGPNPSLEAQIPASRPKS